MKNRPILIKPQHIADEGERIYRETLKEKLEKSKEGQFVAIDVLTGKHFVEKYAENALIKARGKVSFGVFHLIKIGGSIVLGSRYVGQHGSN